MGKPTLIISILIIICVVGIFILKAKNPPTPAMTSYQPTPSERIAPPSPTPQATILLTITSPTSMTVTTPTITVSGQTAPSADVFVNETQLSADSQGMFSTNVTLDEGENTIVIDANDVMGNSAEKELTVTYTPSQ